MIFLQTMPPDVPWWVLVMVIPASAWFSTQVWPWIIRRLDAGAVAREQEEDEARQRQEARDERRVRAQEQQAEALGQIRRFMEAMDFRWSAIESYLDPDRKGRRVIARERGRSGDERIP